MATKKSNTPRSFPHEILGILLFTLGAFVLLCLFSYSSTDVSFNTASSSTAIQNYGGIVGAYLSDLLIKGLGLASYLVGGIFILASYFCFTKKRPRLNLSEGVLLGIFLVMTTILFHLIWEKVSFRGSTIMAGGLVGGVLGGVLRKYLSEVGSYFVVTSLGLLALTWATKISLPQVMGKIILVGNQLIQFLSSKFTIYWARFKKYLGQLRQDFIARQKEKARLKKQKAKAVKINLPKREKNDREAQSTKLTRLHSSTSAKNSQNEIRSEPKIFQKIETKTDLKKEDQLTFGKFSEDFELPALALLDPVPKSAHTQVDEESLKASSLVLENKLKDYNVEGRVTEIHPGPVVTMYEFEPAAGVKVSKITNLSDDLSLSMGGRPVRIVAPLPGKPAVGIEIPNSDREIVYYKEIVVDHRFQKNDSKLALALGKNIEGAPVVADLAKMPHLLVAGATGAGKSVGLNSFIVSLLLKNTPEEVRFIFIDPKMLELSIYEDIPHLLLPVVTQPKKATAALVWAVKEMERRYKLLSDAQVRNINSYNKKFEAGDFEDHKPKPVIEGSDEDPIRHEEKLPYIVIIIDELADLMMVSGREIEEYITRLAQMARAAGIHMILATQRPSVDVITGIIKANFPSRIAFKVTSKHDSRTILDAVGAEHLLGNGDMLFIPPGLAKQTRVHGAFVSDQEIQRIVKHLKEQGKPIYNEEIMNMKVPSSGPGGEGDDESDELYDQAVAIVTETRQASISMVQRRLRIGYNRAARLIEQMETEGIVSAPMGSKGREVLVRGFGTDG